VYSDHVLLVVRAPDIDLMGRRVRAESEVDPGFLNELFVARHEGDHQDRGRPRRRGLSASNQVDALRAVGDLTLMKDVLDAYETVAHTTEPK
jgi:hypothetical protein